MHFNLKSLAFYASAIGSVLVLFSLATNYGESRLKAPAKIDGFYRIAAQDLPGCLKAEALVLNVQQSGVYLAGALLAADQANKLAAEQEFPLTGTWEQQQLVLSGLPIHLSACQRVSSRSGKLPTVKIAGTINAARNQATERTLQGKIQLDAAAASFVGKREATSNSSHAK